MSDNDQLRLIAELSDELQEPMEVHVVKRDLDLVHYIERRWATSEYGK